MLKQILKENRENLKQTLLISKVDLIKFYKGTALGYAWAVIRPLVTIGVYLFAFTFIRENGKMDGFPYFLWLVAGLTPWFFMSDAIIGGAMSIRQYRHFVTKIKFPVSTIPTFTILSKLYVQIMLVGCVVVVFSVFGFFPDKYYLQLLVYIPMMYVFFVALSWSLASLSAISRDFENLVKATLQAVLWLSPILWNINSVGNPILRFILKLNPIHFFIQGYRNIFLYKRWFFESPYFIYIIIVTVILAIIGSRVYKKTYQEFTDVL